VIGDEPGNTDFDRVCQVLCVNDLDFVVGFGFVVVLGFVVGFGFVVVLGFGVVVGFGDGVQGKGFPLPLHIHVEGKTEVALCQSPWPGHALGPQDGEVI
jgi:hypothetical protein